MSATFKRPYLGPRVRGLRISELPRDKLLMLAYSNTLDEFLNVLKTTPYAVSIDKLTRENIAELRRELIKIYLGRVRSIFLSSGKDVKEVVLASIKFFEFDNIRNIAIAVRAGKNPEDFIIWEPLEFTRRRHIIASLLGSKNVEEVGARLEQLRHPASKAFALAAKYGEDKISFFIDRQWLEDFTNTLTAKRERSLTMFAEEIRDYINVSIAIRARIWGLSDELNELIVGRPTPVVLSAARDPPAKFLEVVETLPWGKLLISVVAESPSLENIAVAMDNIYPAYMKKLSDIYMARFTEFSLGALAAQLEYMRAEVVTIIKAASLIAEGISAEKRKEIFEPLIKI